MNATVECGYGREERHLKMHHGAGNKQQNSVSSGENCDYKGLGFLSSSTGMKGKNAREVQWFYIELLHINVFQ